MEIGEIPTGSQPWRRLTSADDPIAAHADADVDLIIAALFVSTKTVEANLGRVYRMWGIRNHAQLAGHISELGG